MHNAVSLHADGHGAA